MLLAELSHCPPLRQLQNNSNKQLYILGSSTDEHKQHVCLQTLPNTHQHKLKLKIVTAVCPKHVVAISEISCYSPTPGGAVEHAPRMLCSDQVEFIELVL